MYRLRWTLPLLALVIVAAGCATTGYDTRYPDRRYPDRRHPDTRRVDHRASRYYRQVDSDVHAYVHRIDRHLRLDRRQQQRIQRVLDERTYRLLDRTRPREHARVYPFPRRADRYHDGATDRWWRSVDDQIERTLDRRQRDIYRSMTRRYDDRSYRDDRRYDDGKNRGSHRGRGRKRGHHDSPPAPAKVAPRGATLQSSRDAY